MRFDRTWPLLGDPSALRARVVDPDGRRAAFAADGGRHVEVEVVRTGHLEVVRCAREVPTGARGGAATVVGRHLAVVQTEWWSEPDAEGVVTGRLEVAFPGRPVSLDAEITVRPTTTGCSQHVTGRARAAIPGVGRLVEAQVVRRTLADLARHLPLDVARSSA